jgi:hypothetical protein
MWYYILLFAAMPMISKYIARVMYGMFYTFELTIGGIITFYCALREFYRIEAKFDAPTQSSEDESDSDESESEDGEKVVKYECISAIIKTADGKLATKTICECDESAIFTNGNTQVKIVNCPTKCICELLERGCGRHAERKFPRADMLTDSELLQGYHRREMSGMPPSADIFTDEELLSLVTPCTEYHKLPVNCYHPGYAQEDDDVFDTLGDGKKAYLAATESEDALNKYGRVNESGGDSYTQLSARGFAGMLI